MVACGVCGEANPERARFCLACGTPLVKAAPVREVRKTVTVVFCDLVGSTQLGERLDQEPLRRVLDRYFAVLQEAVARHGGTVEKFIGDAVMAVFGVPVLHEDDAIRAVRAANEMVRAIDELNPELDARWGVRLQVRVGVNTGEVVAGDAAGGQRLASGDAVNLAARLEGAAGSGEVLLGQSTYRLVRDTVRAERLAPLLVKGKADPVVPYRLLEVLQAAVHGAALVSPLVGRAAELAALDAAFAAASENSSPGLMTVVGMAGMGKSRLLAEFLGGVEQRATVLAGRCLPYGQGITFWPVREMLVAAAGWAEKETPEQAVAKLADLLPGEPDAELIADRVAQLVGVAAPVVSLQEGFWGLRQLLEGLARWKPLVVVVDDIHWAEQGLLDLLDYVTSTAKGPLLVLCGARPELFETHPDSTAVAERLILEPLSAEDSDALVHNLLGAAGLPAAVTGQVLTAAEGNPLFVEQLLAMLIDDGLLERHDGAWTATRPIPTHLLPASVSALLTARLERLALPEQREIEAASVVGRVFWRGAVAELAAEAVGSAAGAHLQELVGRHLIQPDVSSVVPDDAFRFRHILIRDAAYARMPKSERATAHSRFADWLTGAVGGRATEYEEILGYHLEQAYRLRTEVGALDEADRELGRRAGRLLASAGQRSYARGDFTATINLLSRAGDLLLDDDPTRVDVLTTLGHVLTLNGDMEEAQAALARSVQAATSLEDRRREMRARLTLAEHWTWSDPKTHSADIARVSNEAITALSALGGDAGLAEAWQLKGVQQFASGLAASGEDSLRHSLNFAERSGDRRLEREPRIWLANVLANGPTPVDEALLRLDDIAIEASGDPPVEGALLQHRAQLTAMQGDFDRAKGLIGAARMTFEDLGMAMIAAGCSLVVHDIALREGDATAALEMLHADERALARMGEEGARSTIAGMLADALLAADRLDEAKEVVEVAEALSSEDDLLSAVLWRGVRAKLLARRGRADEALDLAKQATARAGASDWLSLRGETLLNLAYVEGLVGDSNRAMETRRAAEAVLLQKGDVALAAQAAAGLEQGPPHASDEA